MASGHNIAIREVEGISQREKEVGEREEYYKPDIPVGASVCGVTAWTFQYLAEYVKSS